MHAYLTSFKKPSSPEMVSGLPKANQTALNVEATIQSGLKEVLSEMPSKSAPAIFKTNDHIILNKQQSLIQTTKPSKCSCYRCPGFLKLALKKEQ